MDSATIQIVIADVDERIKSMEAKSLILMMKGVISFVVDGVDLGETLHSLDADKYKKHIEILKVEKLIYQSLMKADNNKIFPLLYAKYANLIVESLENAKTWFVKEQDYIEYANKTKTQMAYIEKVCQYGERR